MKLSELKEESLVHHPKFGVGSILKPFSLDDISLVILFSDSLTVTFCISPSCSCSMPRIESLTLYVAGQSLCCYNLLIVCKKCLKKKHFGLDL